MAEQLKIELSNITTVNDIENKLKEKIDEKIDEVKIVADEIKIVIEHKLSEEQDKILKMVYDKIKDSTDLILHHPKFENGFKLAQLIASIIKQLEAIKLNEVFLSGKDKKAIALELGRTLIKDLIKEDEKRAILLMFYDTTAEGLLETMVDVSQHLNVKVKEIAESCCDNIISMIIKLLKKD